MEQLSSLADEVEASCRIELAVVSGGNSASLGWALIAVGLLIGAVAGGWFWFRWGPPPPAASDDPFSPARWGLIALHVGCLAVGFVLAAWG